MPYGQVVPSSTLVATHLTTTNTHTTIELHTGVTAAWARTTQGQPPLSFWWVLWCYSGKPCYSPGLTASPGTQDARTPLPQQQLGFLFLCLLLLWSVFASGSALFM